MPGFTSTARRISPLRYSRWVKGIRKAVTAKYSEVQAMSIARPEVLDVLEISKAKFSDESNTPAKQSSRSDRAMTVSLKVVTEAPILFILRRHNPCIPLRHYAHVMNFILKIE